MTMDRLFRIDIDDKQVCNELQRLNVGKYCGPDDLHSWLIKQLVSVLCKPLKLLYDTCIYNSCIISVWTEATITSIYKKGNKSAKDYRPISLTCITCKVLESIVRDLIIYFMQTRYHFSKLQHGFMS